MTCDLNRSADQRQILDAAAAMLEARYPLARLRERQPDDLGEIAGFGAFALALPEEDGGAGFSVVEEMLLHVALGRHVVSTRALATALAPRLGGAPGEEACAAIPDGETLLLLDSGEAGLAVVFDGRRLELIAAPAGEAVEGLGHSVALRRVARAGVTVLGAAGPDVLAIADLLISAQLLGLAEAARDLTVAYVQVRQQFGRPIGAFQAIKHRCADMAIAAEVLSAQLDMAAVALRDGWAEAGFQLAALRLLAPQLAFDNTRACIQLHGGIGFSDEADAHHFLKQVHLLARLGRGEGILDLRSPMAPHR